MAKFEDFLTSFQTEFKAFATTFGEKFKDAAVEHGNDFFNNSKEDLQQWTESLVNGTLTKEEFEWILASKKDALEIVALEKIGLTKVACDRFVKGVLDLMVSSAAKTFL